MNHISSWVNLDTTSINGDYSAFALYGRNANGMMAFYHVLDTHDSTTNSGRIDELIYGVGRHRYSIANIISTTTCKVPPDRVNKYFTVFAHDFNDEDLGCGKDATVGNPCHVATGNKYQREVDADGEILPLVRHYNSKLTGIDFDLGGGWLTAYHRRLHVYLTSTGATARHRRDDGFGEPFTRSNVLVSGKGALCDGSRRLSLDRCNRYRRRAESLSRYGESA